MQFYANMTLTCFFFHERTSDSWRGGGIDKGADWTWEVLKISKAQQAECIQDGEKKKQDCQLATC